MLKEQGEAIHRHFLERVLIGISEEPPRIRNTLNWARTSKHLGFSLVMSLWYTQSRFSLISISMGKRARSSRITPSTKPDVETRFTRSTFPPFRWKYGSTFPSNPSLQHATITVATARDGTNPRWGALITFHATEIDDDELAQARFESLEQKSTYTNGLLG